MADFEVNWKVIYIKIMLNKSSKFKSVNSWNIIITVSLHKNIHETTSVMKHLHELATIRRSYIADIQQPLLIKKSCIKKHFLYYFF